MMWILNCTQKNTARMEEYMKERIKWIDILRAIAIIFVVIGHTLTEGEVQTYFYSFHIHSFRECYLKIKKKNLQHF